MQNKVIIGRFGKTHGIKGWLKVISFTEPQTAILNYQPWLIYHHDSWHSITIVESQEHANTILVKLPNIDSPEIARQYTNSEIAIEPEQLPVLNPGEYYWSELEGLTVIDTMGNNLGAIDHLFATGANDVIVVKGKTKEYLIPYIDQVVMKIDLKQRTMQVDWQEPE